ncbi:MAG: hypothetical protein EOM23_01980, partial [Candidatus Moranbacteria bacterium]|nr:hypothetical protein [Candidatus Moranbacteria bacterium]
MVNFGVTPVEAAYEVIGLTNAYLLIEYIFKSAWGAVVFGMGFFLALARFLRTQNIATMIHYFALCLVILLVFIFPSGNITRISSSMENQGYRGVGSEEIFQESQTSRRVPTALLFISQAYNNLVVGAIAALNVAV